MNSTFSAPCQTYLWGLPIVAFAEWQHAHEETFSVKSGENHEALDGRAAWFYEAVTNDPAMQSKTPGKDQIYLAAYVDSDKEWLDGSKQ